ncbi:N-acetylglucosamine-6-phosphate deacetylase [Bacillus tuaregi]|uniref:N-acetylglucosamine-6-phosphate deacetylase n=1 Tax=Bacillus tuaregi TaxID=1816695 RepID=UPI0008F9026F|nr:N-acetylglucosamine-6-phosphate deacetylase [Bacillus tuaregi]
MSRTFLTQAKIYTGEAFFPEGFLLIENDQIAAVGRMEELPDIKAEDKVIELHDKATVMPGFIDVHIHGAGGADAMDATPEALATISSALPKEGTTSFLATTMSTNRDQITAAVQNVAAYMDNQNTAGAEVLGIHLEGPFLNPKRAGAQDPGNIIEPSIELFQKWIEAGKHQIKLVTLAPEQEGGCECVQHMASLQVMPSIGHSDAVYAEVEKAVQHGVKHATHLFNGMRGLHHREAGTAGAVLLMDEVKVEMIVDGIHIASEMVKLAYKLKGAEGIVLITDAMRAKGLGAGRYDLGGQEVIVDTEKGRATLEDGTLAGSILKYRDAVANMIDYTGCSLDEIVTMASVNPAKQINVFDRKGSLSAGKDADIVVVDDSLEILMTFCRGKMVYTRSAVE